MFGGIKYQQDGNYFESNSVNLNNRQITNELWRFNIDTRKWRLINPNDSTSADSKEAFKNYVLPVAVAGHSSVLINNQLKNSSSLFVFFGYSEYYGATLNLIQEYELGLTFFNYFMIKLFKEKKPFTVNSRNNERN